MPIAAEFTDYRIDGTTIYTPTSGRWVSRRPVDVQGDNRPIYSGVRAFEIKWKLVANEDWADLQVFFNQVAATGTHVVRLPGFPTVSQQAHAFREYSGVTLAEPQVGPYFETFPRNVTLIIGNITVE
jgi:hypothetical protein